jgi:hypothetical protein
VGLEDSAMSADDTDRTDRPPKEPEGFTQQDQLKALREEDEHDDVFFDTTEQEEMRLLVAEFGHPPDPDGPFRRKTEEDEAL